MSTEETFQEPEPRDESDAAETTAAAPAPPAATDEPPPHEDEQGTHPESGHEEGWVSPTFAHLADDAVDEEDQPESDPTRPPEEAHTQCPTCGAPWDGFAPLGNDPYTETCPDCKGFGETITGSLVPDQVTRTCPGCNGRGYRDSVQAPSVTLTTPFEQASEPAAEPEPISYDWRYRT